MWAALYSRTSTVYTDSMFWEISRLHIIREAVEPYEGNIDSEIENED